MLDTVDLKKEFPFFKSFPHYIYLDSAATTQKPAIVLDALAYAYTFFSFPVHRSRYAFSEKVEKAQEDARSLIANYLGCDPGDICFLPSATMASSFFARSYLFSCKENVQKIILSRDAHHSLLASWIEAESDKKIEIQWLSPTFDGEFDYGSFERMLEGKPEMVILPLISHSLGYKIQIDKINELLKKKKSSAYLIFDASQAVASMNMRDVIATADGVFFSGHKAYGPLGVGVLYLSSRMQSICKHTPLLGGGGLEIVEQTRVKPLPYPFSWEAGSPNIPAIYAQASAFKWMQEREIIKRAEVNYPFFKDLLLAFLNKASCKVISGKTSSSIISFYHSDIHAHDIALALDKENIAVRSGFLCSDLMHINSPHYPAIVRMSFGAYTTMQDIEKCIQSLTKILT